MVGINYCLMVGSLVMMKPRESVEILGMDGKDPYPS